MRIRVTRIYGEAPRPPIVAEFGPEGGTIGRDVSCTLVLADPFKYVSRLHAEIRFDGEHWVLTDRGSKVPVMIGDEEVGRDGECDLTDGDALRIGQIEMRVEMAPSPHNGPPQFDNGPVPGSGVGVGVGGIDGRDGLDGPDVNWPPSEPVWPSEPEPDVIGPALARLIEEARRRAEAQGAFVDTPRTRPTDTVNTLNGEVLGPSRPGHVSDAEAASEASLLEAFVDGLRCRPEGLPGALDARYMRMLGETMAALASGMHYLLMTRAQMKAELGAVSTEVRERANNPLKFVQSPEHALQWLLAASTKEGFLPPPAAVAEAFHDVMAHQLGFVAGTRAAIRQFVASFAPGEVERRIEARGLLDRILPMHRRASLWDLYVEHYGRLGADAEEDYWRRFGQVMLAAYESEVRVSRQPQGRSAGGA